MEKNSKKSQVQELLKSDMSYDMISLKTDATIAYIKSIEKAMNKPTLNLLNISAQQIKKHVQKIRNQGEYVVMYDDGSFGVILHSELHKIHSFEERIELLNKVKNSKHDLSSCSPSDVLCFLINLDTYNN